MEEQFIISMFGMVFMALFVIAFFGALAVEIVLGRPAGLAYMDITARVLFEVLAAGGIVGVSWQTAKLMIPGKYLQTIVWALAAVAVVSWVFVVVRNSQFFKDFPHAWRRGEGDATPAAQDRDPQP